MQFLRQKMIAEIIGSLDTDPDSPMSHLLGSSVTYRIAVGPQQGRKVFAPNSKHRALITPARRGRGREIGPDKQGEEKTPFEHRVAMTWAQRLKREFAIDVETCGECGGTVKVIASIA
jgi:hypothetical protein